MATEAALLGTPSIFISTLADKMGNFVELEKKYGLLYTYKNEHDAYLKISHLLNHYDIKNKWTAKREILLKDKIDVTSFMVDIVETQLIK